MIVHQFFQKCNPIYAKKILKCDARDGDVDVILFFKRFRPNF